MKRWGAGVAVLAILLVTVFVFLRWNSERDSGDKVSVRLAWLPGATFAGDYVAVEKGLWREQGLDVTVAPGGFEFDAIKLVTAGIDTFGVSSGPQLLQARASGLPVVAIGSTIPRSPIGWVSRLDSGITKPQDFVGKKVGAQFGTHTEITFEALMARLKIDPNSVTRVPIKFDPSPFINRLIDVFPVYLIDQPIELRASGIELNEIDPGQYGVSLAYGNAYFTTEDTLRRKPELVRKFLAGAEKGWMFAYNNRAEAADILAKFASQTPKNILVAKMEATFKFVAPGDGYKAIYPMDTAALTETAALLKQFGELQGNPADVARELSKAQ